MPTQTRRDELIASGEISGLGDGKHSNGNRVISDSTVSIDVPAIRVVPEDRLGKS